MRLEVFRTDAENPRTDAGHLSILATKHRNYDFGEERIPEPIDWLEKMLKLKPIGEYSNQRFQELTREFLKNFIALPVYIYEHSGVTVSITPFGCPWDSGQLGFIYTPKEVIREVYKVGRVSPQLKAKILANMEEEIVTLNQYISGEVYGYRVLDENDVEHDSCHGFFGNNFAENGMSGYIDEAMLGITQEEKIELLKNIKITD